MTAADLTAILGSLGGLVVVGIAVLTFVKTSKAAKAAIVTAAKVDALEKERLELEARRSEAETKDSGWVSMTQALQADRLATDARYLRRVQEVEEESDRRITKMREALREEMEDLLRQIKVLKQEILILSEKQGGI